MNPSAILQAAFRDHEMHTYGQIMEVVYPVLDALPAEQRAALTQALQTRVHEFEPLLRVDQAGRTQEIEDELRKLKEAEDDQSRKECAFSIRKLIHSWLSVLWTVGVEESVYLENVSQCIDTCYESFTDIPRRGGNGDFPPIEIRSAAGVDIFCRDHANTKDVVVFVWRDLILSPHIQAEEEVYELCWEDIRQAGLQQDVIAACTDPRFPTAHWSEETRLASESLKARMLEDSDSD